MPKRIRPTGPQGEAQFEGREVVQEHGCGCGRGRGQGCGHRRGRGRGARLPNQLLTLSETVEFIKQAAAKQSQKEKRWRQSKSL